MFIVRSLHGADAVLLVLRSAATLLVALILPTPGGSGGLEGLYALFIGPLMPQALMAPTLLLWRLLDYYLFIALGAYLFLDLMRTAPPPAVPDGRAVRGGGSAERESWETSVRAGRSSCVLGPPDRASPLRSWVNFRRSRSAGT